MLRSKIPYTFLFIHYSLTYKSAFAKRYSFQYFFICKMSVIFLPTAFYIYSFALYL